eukprot:m.134549 g.134549  ORF g.134549 m.134549 type:complete len:68 (+) comp9632_c0_seq1:1324-1527(+)
MCILMVEGNLKTWEKVNYNKSITVIMTVTIITRMECQSQAHARRGDGKIITRGMSTGAILFAACARE